jgi:hypothetical protein
MMMVPRDVQWLVMERADVQWLVMDRADGLVIMMPITSRRVTDVGDKFLD